ncbi:MAG: hypothetical protein ACQEQX_10630 [Thermodesulfobacteriota bacterium]
MGCDCQDCQFPHKLKDKPEDCTPEQIQECHGQEAAKEKQENGE